MNSLEHKKIAIDLFNLTWELLDKTNRSHEEDMLMIHQAHASLYHWMQCGTAVNVQRGEWMISRVYSTLRLSESALLHARNCMELTTQHALDDYDLTFAYEALTRAFALKDVHEAGLFLSLAYASLYQIKDDQDRKYAKEQLDELNRVLETCKEE